MKSDRICWIDSRTIKRGRVLVLDGYLVPFCSKCLDACMRANVVLKKFEKIKFGSLLTKCGWSAHGARTVRSTFENWTRDVVVFGVGWKMKGGRSAPLTQVCTREDVSLVGLMV